MPEGDGSAGGNLLVPHLLFGTFRRESRGYRTVCRSSGMSDILVRSAERACAGWGDCVESEFRTATIQQPRAVTEGSGEHGIWYLVIRVSNLGTDHSGRPGALCFHVLFFDEEAYSAIGFEPFRLMQSEVFVGDWDGRDSWPPAFLEPDKLPAPPAPVLQPKELQEVHDQLIHLMAGHRVRFSGRLPSAQTDDRLALLFRLLPWSYRRHTSAATFTFNTKRDYALAVEYSSQSPRDPLRPQPMPSLPRDLPAAAVSYAKDVVDALGRRDFVRVQELARCTNPHAALPSALPPPGRRSVLERLFKRD